MSTSYSIMMSLGASLFLIIFGLLALIVAKSGKWCWILYGIGTVLTALSLWGRVLSSRNLYGYVMSHIQTDIIVFVVLAVIFAILICCRRKKATGSASDDESAPSSGSDNPS